MTEPSANRPAKRAIFSLSWRFLLTFFAVIFLDQLTKLAIIHYLPWPDSGAPIYDLNATPAPISVIDGFFYIVHITNEGAAWGILSGQTFLLTSIALVTLLAMWFFRHQIGFQYPQMQIAMGLFCGGIIGNLIDRISYGHVVDFLDVHLPIIDYRWPAFNIADIAIFLGVSIYIIVSMVLEHRQNAEIKSGKAKHSGNSK